MCRCGGCGLETSTEEVLALEVEVQQVGQTLKAPHWESLPRVPPMIGPCTQEMLQLSETGPERYQELLDLWAPVLHPNHFQVQGVV